MLAQVVVSNTGALEILLAMSNLHCLSARMNGQIAIQDESKGK